MIWLHRIFGRTTSSASQQDRDWLLDRELFQASLERERLRVDRSDGVFSLMVVSTREANKSPAAERLAGVLRPRIRRTDTAGWFDRSRVGVILPDTPSHGAYKLASDLSAFYEDPATCPIFDIYTHPADEQLPTSDQPSERDEALVETVANSAFESSDRRTRVSRAQSTAQFSRIDRPFSVQSTLLSRPIESLLVQPQPIWKRALDIFGAGLGLAILSPVLAVTAIAVKRSSPGPIIFAQQREGLGGRIFTMYKFRTMCTDAEALKAQLRKFSEQDGPAFKLTNDPRITPLGHFLRKTCIDELPQLWNVLRGEMSLVGPRPLPVDESRNCRPWQRRRLAIKPGLTCIWQVEGGINVTFDQWMRMDLQYAAARTPVSDARLLWKTFTKVLLRRASR